MFLSHIEVYLRPWQEPVEYYEAVTHIMGWLVGMRALYRLEGKKREEEKVRLMGEEMESRTGIKLQAGLGVYGSR